MISKLAHKITRAVLGKNYCETNGDKFELTAIGLFLFLSELLYFLICVILGIIFNVFWESVVFFVVFKSIRRFAGGFHAETETACEIISAILISACILLMKFVDFFRYKQAVLIMVSLASLIIILTAPEDSPAKPLEEIQKKKYKIISLILLAVIAALIIISLFYKIKFIFAPCCISVVFESVLLAAGKIKGYYSERRQTA